jgi:hypothetical protein
VRPLRYSASVGAVAFGVACSQTSHTSSTPGVAGDVRREATPVRLNQIFGDYDRAFTPPIPTLTQSATRVGLWGTDDGASFVYGSRVVFLFGDCVPAVEGDPARPRDADVVSWADAAATPEQGFDLHFFTDASGRYVPVTLDGQFLPALQGPTGGFSDGQLLYAFFVVGVAPANHSVFAVSEDDGLTFQTVMQTPGNATQVFPQVVATSTVEGLGAQWANPTSVLIFGRRGPQPPLLAAAPIDQVRDAAAWRWFSRDARSGSPLWVTDAASAAPIFVFDPGEDSVGGFSVFWLPGVDRWIATYPVGDNGVYFRSAKSALGPWSEPAILFDPDPAVDRGYCNFVHRGCEPSACCDVDYDPVRYGAWGPTQSGRVYAPQPVLPWTQSDEAAGTSTLYFLMSTGNPYTAMTMRAVLQRIY